MVLVQAARIFICLSLFLMSGLLCDENIGGKPRGATENVAQEDFAEQQRNEQIRELAIRRLTSDVRYGLSLIGRNKYKAAFEFLLRQARDEESLAVKAITAVVFLNLYFEFMGHSYDSSRGVQDPS